MQISDTEQLTNILNDLKEYFPSTRREDITEKDRVRQTVEWETTVDRKSLEIADGNYFNPED